MTKIKGNNYQRKTKEQGRGDTYGTWREGKQVSAEILGGRVVSDLRRGIQ